MSDTSTDPGSNDSPHDGLDSKPLASGPPPPALVEPLRPALDAFAEAEAIRKAMAEPLRSAFEESARLQAATKAIVDSHRASDFSAVLEQLRRSLNAHWIKPLTIPFASTVRTLPEAAKLQTEIADLYTQVDAKTKALQESKAGAIELQAEVSSLKDTVRKLEDRLAFAHLLTRISARAQERMLTDESFRQLFRSASECQAFVISIDVRRSTELMLKAREPKLYAEFITTLARRLRDVVTSHYGVFDKFTGDGVLAFFPDFYSGDDAGYYALAVAAECHQAFARLYEKSRGVFSSVLLDVGLGIGIDCGAVHVVAIGEEYTVVGSPVVYACRLSGARGGTTLVNQPAYERVCERYPCFGFEDSEVEVKHEGRTLAYSVSTTRKQYEPRPPAWEAVPPPSESAGVLDSGSSGGSQPVSR